VVTEDDEVGALYQVPLGEFTAARNALAKTRGAAGGAIRTLEKPSAPAWAVNQVYWQRRNAYDEVIRTALAMGVLGSAKKEAAERAARKQALQKQLRAAEVAERAAETAAAEARTALARVERDYAATRDKLQFLEKQRVDAEQDAHRRARALQDAANTRTQAAQDLERLRD